MPVNFNLSQLFVNQSLFIVKATISPFIFWIYDELQKNGYGEFAIVDRNFSVIDSLRIFADYPALKLYMPEVEDEVNAFLSNSHISKEDVTKLAGYCIALIKCHLFMSGRKVLRTGLQHPPDLIFTTSIPYEGVEVAARSNGKIPAIRTTVYGPLKPNKKRKNHPKARKSSDGKWHQLDRDLNISECHLSVSELSSMTSLWAQVKP